MSTRRRFLAGPALALVCATALSAAQQGSSADASQDARSTAKPNVVLIVADDLGWADLGVQGARDVRTPNLDRLAAEGVRFTCAYSAAPLCAPSRAALLSGRYPQRFGLESNPGSARAAAADYGVPRDERLLSERLKAAGYATCLVGKWHLGYSESMRPLARGFERFFGFLSGSSRYVGVGLRNPILRGDEPVAVEKYLTDAFADEAVRFVSEHADRPFFLYVPFNAPHSPLEAPEDVRAKFANIAKDERRTYAAMVAKLDEAVGRILDELTARGLDERTLVIFVSDNGGASVENAASNAPWRGEKPALYEGGVRVPFLARWKGRFRAGVVEPRMVSLLDVTPTVLAAAGAAPPERASEPRPLDGVDLGPLLSGDSKGRAHDALFWRLGGEAAARVGDLKLVRRGTAYELYDLAEDPGEKRDLAKRKPQDVAKLSAALEAWERGMVAPRFAPKGDGGGE